MNKGYTFVQREYYSKSAVRLRELSIGYRAVGQESRMSAGPDAPWCVLGWVQNMVRIDSHEYNADKIVIQDFNKQQTVTITPQNATYPQGACQVRSTTTHLFAIQNSLFPGVCTVSGRWLPMHWNFLQVALITGPGGAV